MKTTLNKIREYSPCPSGWKKLLTYIGKTEADYEPLSLLTILDSNGLDDALWCLRAVEGHDKEIRLYAVWCARQMQHVMTDQRSLDALDVAERYANGEATKSELKDAWYAARDAMAAARGAAAWYAAYAAETACSAAGAARGAAAWDAAWAAETAWDAENARFTVCNGAKDAAWVEMRRRQEAELRRICEEARGE